MNRRTRYVLVVVVILAAIAILAATGARGAVTYYYTVDELLAQSDTFEGQFVQVHGVVTEGSLDWDPTQVRLAFTLAPEEGGVGQLPIVYQGARPDNLQAGTESVVAGRLGPDGVFQAAEILVKCPSKYEAKPES